MFVPSPLGLGEGSVVLTPTAIFLQGSRDAVRPRVCSVMEVAVVVVVVVATVVFRVCSTETVVGPYRPGKVLASGGSSSPVGPQAMNSVSVVGRLPRKSKLLSKASCACLRPRFSWLCCSAAPPAATAEDEEDDEEARVELDLAVAGGLVRPPLGTRVAAWSLGLWARLARDTCICPWARSTRGARGVHMGVGGRDGCPLRRLHRRGGRWAGRGMSRNSGPGPSDSQDGKSTASCSMAISIQAWLPRERPGQRMDMELQREDSSQSQPVTASRGHPGDRGSATKGTGLS